MVGGKRWSGSAAVAGRHVIGGGCVLHRLRLAYLCWHLGQGMFAFGCNLLLLAATCCLGLLVLALRRHYACLVLAQCLLVGCVVLALCFFCACSVPAP